MRTITRADRLRYGKFFAVICAVCTAAGGLFAISAEKLPVILGKTASAAAEFIYGRVTAVSETEKEDTVSVGISLDANVTGRVTAADADDVDDTGMISYGMIFPSSENEDPVFIEGSMESPITEDTDEKDGGDHDGRITDTVYGYYSGDAYIDLPNGGQVRNVTDIPNSELEALAEITPNTVIAADGTPEVLIIHTHTTETYETEDKDWYDSSVGSRCSDPEKNVCAVGREISLKLNEKGIGVIHDTTVHDYPSYNGAYDRSRETASAILEKYPTIKVILDIHRDAIERGGERIAPTVEINGRKAAQIMIICGCDGENSKIPEFRENFKFACFLQSRFESDHPTLTRPVLFDYRFYNQDMTTGSLLIEVGGHANTLEEAKYSGSLVGESLAEALLSLRKT